MEGAGVLALLEVMGSVSVYVLNVMCWRNEIKVYWGKEQRGVLGYSSVFLRGAGAGGLLHLDGALHR